MSDGTGGASEFEDAGKPESGSSGNVSVRDEDSSDVFFDGEETWVDGSQNDVGIQGAFFMMEDSVKDGKVVHDDLSHGNLFAETGGDEEEAPFSTFTGETDAPCIHGTIAKATTPDGSLCESPTDPNCAWEAIWRGGIGMNLNESGGEESTSYLWDATAYGVSGFEFSTTGDIDQATLRFKAIDATHPEEDFCLTVRMGADVRVDLDDLKHNCWTDGHYTLDQTQLRQIQWQIAADWERSHDIRSFCVTEVATY